MKLRILAATAAAAIAVALSPATAWAKGAESVIITGPGLRQPVHIGNTSGSQPVEVNRLAEATGLLYAAFRTTPTPMTHKRPAGRLGPRFRARYVLYASENSTVTVRQDLYPFAAAGFVSYTPPHQHLFQRTARSGWYITTDTYNTGIDSAHATAMLVAVGARNPHPNRTNSARATCTSPTPFGASGAPNEVHGRSTSASVWGLALGPGRVPPHVNDELKIVWRMTGHGPLKVTVTAPDGHHEPLTFGPDEHSTSTYRRPGNEWGTGVRFTSPGCWHIHLARTDTTGDAWLDVPA